MIARSNGPRCSTIVGGDKSGMPGTVAMSESMGSSNQHRVIQGEGQEMAPFLKEGEEGSAKGRIGDGIRIQRILIVEIQEGVEKSWRNQEFIERTCSSRHDRKM